MVKKKESASTDIIPATTLISISNELLAMQTKIIEQGGELLEGDLESLKKWEAAIEIKAENICHVLLKMEHEATYYEDLAKAARARAETLSKTDKRLRAYLISAMQATGTKQIKQNGGLFTISLVDGRANAKIDDQNQLPHDMVDIVEVVKPKTTEIKKALEAGKEVPGASLEYGAPYLMIRS